MYRALTNSRVDQRYIQIIKQPNEGVTDRYILQTKTNPNSLKREVRQGDMLFTLALEQNM